MKIFVLLACLTTLFSPLAVNAQQLQEGDFDIRFEPTAKLQTGTPVPFQITVRDSLRKPLVDATVTLQIETADHQKAVTVKAPSIDRGVYMAKPQFPSAGQWNVLVEVHRNDQESARTIQYNVPQ